jgi:hypothetical protein
MSFDPLLNLVPKVSSLVSVVDLVDRTYNRILSPIRGSSPESSEHLGSSLMDCSLNFIVFHFSALKGIVEGRKSGPVVYGSQVVDHLLRLLVNFLGRVKVDLGNSSQVFLAGALFRLAR